MAEQVRYKELLEDPVFKKWVLRVPKPPTQVNPAAKLWVVWVQREYGGRWARARFATYVQAEKFLVKQIKAKVWDATLGCTMRDYAPPLVKVKEGGKPKSVLWRRMPEGHGWCGYCRRPTVFRYFSRHHAFPGNSLYNTFELRCSICGVRKPFLKDWYGRE